MTNEAWAQKHALLERSIFENLQSGEIHIIGICHGCKHVLYDSKFDTPGVWSRNKSEVHYIVDGDRLFTGSLNPIRPQYVGHGDVISCGIAICCRCQGETDVLPIQQPRKCTLCDNIYVNHNVPICHKCKKPPPTETFTEVLHRCPICEYELGCICYV